LRKTSIEKRVPQSCSFAKRCHWNCSWTQVSWFDTVTIYVIIIDLHNFSTVPLKLRTGKARPPPIEVSAEDLLRVDLNEDRILCADVGIYHQNWRIQTTLLINTNNIWHSMDLFKMI
jgi:hypothetical protein